MSAEALGGPLWRPFVFALVAVFAAWLYYVLRRREERRPSEGGRVFHCARCGKVYGEDRERPFSGCPRCGHFNEAVGR
jgi:hypothetical protein